MAEDYNRVYCGSVYALEEHAYHILISTELSDASKLANLASIVRELVHEARRLEKTNHDR